MSWLEVYWQGCELVGGLLARLGVSWRFIGKVVSWLEVCWQGCELVGGLLARL